jgi:cytidine deaminase
MQTKEFKILVSEYETFSELPESDRELIVMARNAAENAYAPYSGFRVGAALLLANGKMLTGNNQENATFTVGLCAERVALFYANAGFPDVAVKALAVTAKNKNGYVMNPVSPCGACRQALLETESRFKNSIRIILEGKNKIQVFEGVENLLPFAFKPETLD